MEKDVVNCLKGLKSDRQKSATDIVTVNVIKCVDSA